MAKDGKLAINYRETELRVHGSHSSRFSNEVGAIVRQFVLLQYRGWGKVSSEDKIACIEKLKICYFVNCLL